MRILHCSYPPATLPGGGAVRTREIYNHFPAGNEIRIQHGREYGGIWSRLRYIRNSHLQLGRAKWDLVVEDFDAHSPTMIPYRWRGKHVAIINNLFGWSHQGVRGAFSQWIERAGFRKIQNAIVQTERDAGIVRQYVPNVWVVYNGFDASLLDTTPHDDNYILFIGRFDVYQKGLDILVSAYNRVSANLPRLVIAGFGKDHEQVRRMAMGNPKISLVGCVLGEEKARLLSGCTYFVMPSRFESWGILAMEAQACGKVVLGSDIPGLRENVIDGKTGILLQDYENPDVWAKAIKRLSCCILDDIGKQARNRAKQFTWEKAGREQHEVYKEIVG